MSSPSPAPIDVCDFCGVSLPDQHEHVLRRHGRNLECVCEACAILFSSDQQKFKRVPRRIRFLPDFQMSDAQWDAMMIPIGIAFLYRSSSDNKTVAIYPSPAGPVESQLTLDAWQEIIAANPRVGDMETDVEGLLVYRTGAIREHYTIPIDECYRLIGIVRMKWKGFSGGNELWDEVEKFRLRLKRKSSAG